MSTQSITKKKAECPRCDGFGWVPTGFKKNHWYQEDWRFMLDPTVEWEPCPLCSDDSSSVQRLHGDLAAVLVQRLQQEADHWVDDGPWQVGVIDEFRRVYRWEDVAVVCEQIDPRRWMLISPMGVAKHLHDEHCACLLEEAGAPPLRPLDS